MQKNTIYAIINRGLIIILLIGAVVIGMYMAKLPATRIYGAFIVIASFALLYTYVVRRRNNPKK